MDRVRVGFIGAGGNTRLRHLPGFAGIQGVELIAVANRSVDSAARVAEEFGIARVHSDWREIVKAGDVDAVCIGTWPNTHAEMTCAALEFGKHVLVEARMAASLAEAQAMAAAAAARPELVAQIVPSPITLEADAIIRNLWESGSLGNPQHIRSDHATSATLDAEALLSWRMDERISGINTMALGICYEPIQRWLAGDAEVTQARAEVVTSQRCDEQGNLHQVVIPEILSVNGRWGDAEFTMHQSSVEAGPAQCRYELAGDQATLRYDVNRRELIVDDRNGDSRQIDLPELTEGGWAVEQEFIASIRSATPVERTNFATGLRYMKFTDAVWQAWSGAGPVVG